MTTFGPTSAAFCAKTVWISSIDDVLLNIRMKRLMTCETKRLKSLKEEKEYLSRWRRAQKLKNERYFNEKTQRQRQEARQRENEAECHRKREESVKTTKHCDLAEEKIKPNAHNRHDRFGEFKAPTRTAPPPPIENKSWSASIFCSKEENGLGKNSTVKKKAPPRPPPPKLQSNLKTRSHDNRNAQKSYGGNSWETWTSDCLIDWSSPPSSPSSATRSNSDALSINSFGSDSVNASSCSTSNVESGFEDDFDSLVNSRVTKSFDPWSVPAPMPLAKAEPTEVKQPFLSCLPNKKIMPTIIRAKPERPAVPKVLEKKYELNALNEVFENSRKQRPGVVDAEEGWISDSIPTAPLSCPPPVPALVRLLGPENVQSSIDSDKAVALYDYKGLDGDLSFRQGDRITIIRHIDSNWVEASLNGLTGTAPMNHLQVNIRSGESGRVAKALYAFVGETWEDLTLQEGDVVTLLARVNADWLYGQVADRRGQFPVTFVDHVPADLPCSSGPNL